MTAEELMERASAREIREYVLLFQLHEDERRPGGADVPPQPDDDDDDSSVDDAPVEDMDALIREQMDLIEKLKQGERPEGRDEQRDDDDRARRADRGE